MPRRILARALGVVAAMTVTLVAAPLAGTAQAFGATSGTLSFSGDPGEPISGGQSYEYSAGAVQMFDVGGSRDGNSLDVAIDSEPGTLWRLIVSAPDGQKLTEGTTYTGAKKWPYVQPGDPQLEFAGIDNGTEKGCNTTSGSFTIEHIAFGPYGYVRELDVAFEQYCNGSTVPLRGAVHAVMPDPCGRTRHDDEHRPHWRGERQKRSDHRRWHCDVQQACKRLAHRPGLPDPEEGDARRVLRDDRGVHPGRARPLVRQAHQPGPRHLVRTRHRNDAQQGQGG